MSHTKEPWIIKKDMIYGNEERESVACVLDVRWPYGFRANAEANSKRIVSCVNALQGLSDDALDGGWNFKSMSKYCKDIESERDELFRVLQEAQIITSYAAAEWMTQRAISTDQKVKAIIAKAKGEAND